MNLPEFLRAHERAWDSYEKACSIAREELGKNLAAAREEFFEESRKAVEADPPFPRERH